MRRISKKSVKRVLVVGSWAKEQITIENIRHYNPDVEVYAYMDTANPGIIDMVSGYEIGTFYEPDQIVEYAKKVKANLLLVTTAAPLSVGVADALEREGIAIFGPNRVAARLEYDKSFARDLMRRHGIDAIPDYATFSDFGPAMDYARSHDWKVAVKPTSLTDGLGVRVFGDQLKSSAEVIDYIDQVLHGEGKGGRVIVEEKLEGEEFSLQCLVNGDHIAPTLAVQDFKKLLPGDEGVNTASMGSYSGTGHLLPFMQQKDYDQALDIIKRTVHSFREETGLECRGFLYGQFMLTPQGIKLIEYNFRPGDPEWLNTVSVLKGSLLDAIADLLNGKTPKLSFERKTAVCKYVVPMWYPEKSDEVLDFSYNRSEAKKQGVKIYYSCGVDEDGKLRVGTERGIALIAKGSTIFDAQKRTEKVMSGATGNFYYRPDIGTRQVIRAKMAYATKMRREASGDAIAVRSPNETEFMRIHRFVKSCDRMEKYPEHLYRIVLRYHGDVCFVAESKGRIVGFVMGMRSEREPEKIFIWEIGVNRKMRGQGVATRLLNAMESKALDMGCRRMEATIDPANRASYSLFEKLGYINVSKGEGETLKVGGKTAVKDYYRPRRHFIVYEKKLI
jgi:phosphoribosylamine--glycine ligase